MEQQGLNMAKKREARLMIATGFKGVGKTWETIKYLKEDYILGNPAMGIPGRRVLILDVNDEYGEFGIKALDPSHIPLFMVHPTIEIRRLRPFTIDKGVARKMTTDEIIALLDYVLATYAGGCLLIEDINKLVGDSMTRDLTGAICTNRHINCDIIMHYQSLARPLPKIHQNADVIRMHWQGDDVLSSKDKLKELTEPLKIAQMLINEQRFKYKNIRFCVYFDKDKNGLIGNFTKQQFEHILEEYISENPSVLGKYMKKIDRNGKKVYTYPDAIDAHKAYLFDQYWQN